MQVMPVRAYLEDRIESLCRLLPGAVEIYLRVELILRAIADGINPVEIIRRQLGSVLVDTWTLDADASGAAETLQAVLHAGVDQITTDTAVQLAGLVGGGCFPEETGDPPSLAPQGRGGLLP